jgi:hypothetical protein
MSIEIGPVGRWEDIASRSRVQLVRFATPCEQEPDREEKVHAVGLKMVADEALYDFKSQQSSHPIYQNRRGTRALNVGVGQQKKSVSAVTSVITTTVEFRSNHLIHHTSKKNPTSPIKLTGTRSRSDGYPAWYSAEYVPPSCGPRRVRSHGNDGSEPSNHDTVLNFSHVEQMI